MSAHTTDSIDIASVDAQAERWTADEIVAWAWRRFGTGLVLTSSFEDPVLIDVVHRVAPETEIAFLDTQYHFAETLWYVAELHRRYDLNLRTLTPASSVRPDNRWQLDVQGCCATRKVEPLGRALEGKRAWLTGIRRVDGPSRANAPIISWDDVRRIVKINPLATWSDDDIHRYIAERDLPVNPLSERGYPSIGCWPCTRPVAPGEDRRAGRWSGLEKTECGLHT